MCLTLLVAPGTPLDGVDWLAPRFERGQEIRFAGEIVDVSERPGKSFRNVYTVTVCLFVLESSDRYCDLAVLTAVTPQVDTGIAAAARNVSGETAVAAKTATTVEFIRRFETGVAKRIPRPATPPPFVFRADSRTDSLPSPPVDGPAFVEVGMFLPRTSGTDDFGREWTREPDTLWNGSRVLDLVASQSSKHYDDLAAAPYGWRRTDRAYVSPTDGLPRWYARRIEQREGKSVIAHVELRLEMKSPIPPGDAAAYRHVRREAEMAAWFATERDRLQTQKQRPDQPAAAALQARIVRFLAEHQPATSFRPAIEALRETR